MLAPHEIESMRKRVTLVVHVGPGNTRALLFEKGHIEEYESYRMGTHRTAEIIEASFVEGESQLRLIRDNASGPISRILFDLRDQDRVVGVDRTVGCFDDDGSIDPGDDRIG